jgi:hypothetical protein
MAIRHAAAIMRGAAVATVPVIEGSVRLVPALRKRQH